MSNGKETDKDALIWAAWELLDENDISTERLIQTVAQYCGVPAARVISAMSRYPKHTETTAP